MRQISGHCVKRSPALARSSSSLTTWSWWRRGRPASTTRWWTPRRLWWRTTSTLTDIIMSPRKTCQTIGFSRNGFKFHFHWRFCICGIFYFVTQVPLMDLQYNFSLPKVLTWWFQSNRSVSITSVSPTSQHSSAGLSFKERSKSVSERGMRDLINVIRKTIKLSVSSRLSFQLSSWEKKKQEMQHFWHNQWKCSD